eukprot:jgi/Antlo1/418/906
MTNTEEKNYICMEYNKGITGVCVFRNDAFVICKDFFDTLSCERAKTMIYKFCVDVCVCTLDIGLDKFDMISETGVEIKIVSKSRRKRIKINRDDCNLSLASLSILDSYLSEAAESYTAIMNTHVFLEAAPGKEKDFLVRLGKISKYTLFLYNEDNSLFIGYNSIAGLNLFRIRSHPNKFVHTEKHDLSLFSSINFCQTKSGAEMLRMWISFPLTSADLISERKEVVEFIIRNKLQSTLAKALKKCSFVDESLKSFAACDVKRYLRLAGEFYRSVSIIQEALRKIYSFDIDTLVPNNRLDDTDIYLFDIVYKIDLESDFIFKSSVDTELHRLREMYQDLPKYLDEVAKKVASECNKVGISIIYFPQVGYLIETSQEMEWELKFRIEDVFYYKNDFMETLDCEFGDLKNRINDLEIELTNLILEEIARFYSAAKNLVSTIDCFVSLAIAAEKHNFVKGEISSDRKMVLGGFFGLGDSVENSIVIDKNIIVTGSNGSGKSTFLRNVANIVIMNQMGSFVPCRQAKIPIFDKIFTKITTKENTSSFKCDLLQLSEGIRFATSDSLVLIDEFGRGSDIIDGTSLLLSIIKNFDYPRVLLTTHLQSFFLISPFQQQIPGVSISNRSYPPYDGVNYTSTDTYFASRSIGSVREDKIAFRERDADHRSSRITGHVNKSEKRGLVRQRSSSIHGTSKRACLEAREELAQRSIPFNFSFLNHWKMMFIHSAMKNRSKRFFIQEGVYFEHEGIEYAEKFGFSKEFILKCHMNKKKMAFSSRKKRNDQWAVKLIQDFMEE